MGTSLSIPNLFLGLFGLELFVFPVSLASNSAILALADANGGLLVSYFIGEPSSTALKLIDGILVPNPVVEAFVVYGTFFKVVCIPIFFPLIKGYIFAILLVLV